MKSFDLHNARLAGTHLIEASAGTGKTYAIEGLFVRLVLEKQLMPGSILVVTFTQSATDELKERIYEKLAAVRRGLSGQKPADDAFVAGLCAEFSEPSRGLRLIQEAISEFDRAAIFTIHGFCQRVLFENAFETGKPFDTEMVEDQRPLVRHIARDFWRSNLYRAAPETIAYVSRKLSGPDALLALLQTGADPDVRLLPEFQQPPALDGLEPLRRAAAAVKKRWPENRAAVKSAFYDKSLSGNVFGGFNPDPRLGGLSQRDYRVSALMAGMDGLVHAEVVVPPLFDGFSKFTTAGIASATRKGRRPPVNDFFGLCDDLASAADIAANELENHLAWFKRSAFETCRVELPERKKALNIQYFDDLLIQVRQALESPGGPALIEAVRRRYRAALVDEFQDTDRIQYDIFSKLFAAGDAPLFLIGDPKQAIYGFRGADIFTYMQAVRHTRERHTLRENWRSSPGLIEAVNALFGNRPAPFLYADIGFEPAVGASKPAAQTAVPMTIWYLDSRKHGRNGKPVPKTVAEPLIVAALAGEITRLLTAPVSETPAGDIAVLVRTNRQARLVKNGLTGHGIPAVLHSTGNIFDSPEAGQLQVVLGCIAQPADSRRAKAAMVTQLWGKQAGDLLALGADPDSLQQFQRRVYDYHRTWCQHGFMSMFRQMLGREQVAVRLMGMPDGERRLTNLLHLGELLHRSSTEMELNPSALVNWLAEQRDPETPRLDAHQLRMESDADAVRIVTVHKSKGLEYPVVFCPFSWEDSRLRGSQLQFHDPRKGHRPTLHLSAGPGDDCRKWAQNEQLAENLRLLYVALTRARHKCYLVWGRIRSAETSALAYLLHSKLRFNGRLDDSDAVAMLHLDLAESSDQDYLTDLGNLADRHPDCLSVAPLPTELPAHLPRRAGGFQPAGRRFCGSIDRTRAIVSYSTLAARRTGDADLPDRDELLSRRPPSPAADAMAPDPSSTAERRDVFAFERGTRAGLFFHELLEKMSYDPDDHEQRTALVQEKLAAHGFDARWRDSVASLLQHVLQIELFGPGSKFCLGRLGAGERVHELEFYFPVKHLTPDILSGVLEPHFGTAGRPASLQRIKELNFGPTRGFVKGYIDMVFVRRGKYYLVDWKSNHLGDTREDYRFDRLEEAMDEHLYELQALIYTLALDQYLRARLPGYSYKKQFGGACYVFLRGIHAAWGPEYGIHLSRPEPDVLQRIREALIPPASSAPQIDGGQE